MTLALMCSFVVELEGIALGGGYVGRWKGVLVSIWHFVRCHAITPKSRQGDLYKADAREWSSRFL